MAEQLTLTQENGSTITADVDPTDPLRATAKAEEPPKTDAPPADPSAPTIKKVQREFPIPLTEKDLAAKARELGELHSRLESAQRTLDAAKGTFKGVEAEVSEVRAVIIDSIRTGNEMRTIECEEVHDFGTNRVYWRRKSETASDLWDLLAERAMTATERQMALKLSDKKGGEYEEAARKDAEEKPAEETTEIKTDAQWQDTQKPEATA